MKSLAIANNLAAHYRILFTLAFAAALTLLWSQPARADDPPEPPPPAQVTIGHFAAFDDTVAATAVDIRVDGTVVLTDVVYGNIAGPLELPADEYLVEILVGDTVAVTNTFELTSGVSYFVAAIGDNISDTTPIELVALVNDTEPISTSAKVRIAHFAPIASDLAATAVDICTANGVAVVSNVQYPDVTGYLELDPGAYDLHISPVETDCETVALDLPPLLLAANTIADVFAIGYLPPNSKAENFPFTVTTSTGLNLVTPAQVTVAHFAPFGDAGVPGTAVDVRVDGTDVLTNVVFGEFAGPLPVPATFPPSQYTVEIVAGDTVAISDTFSLESGVSYFVAATGDGINQPLNLLALIQETTPLTDAARLRVGHLSPFAELVAATAVDLCHNEGTVVEAGIAFGDVSDFELPPGDYNLVVSAAGTNCAPVFDIPALNFAAGDIVEVYAVGYPVPPRAAAFPFDLKTTTGITLSAPVTVTVGHLAPFAEDVAGTAVSVQVNSSEVLSNVVFGNVATAQFAPGRMKVDIVPTAANESSVQGIHAISEVFTLTQGLDYSILAIGGANEWPLGLLLLTNDRSPDAANAKVRIGHLAPFAQGSAATEVAICTLDNEVVGGLAAVPYPVVAPGYLPLPPGEYALKISAANDCETTILELPILNLKAGDIIEVFATGTNTEAFPLAPVIIGEVETVAPPVTTTLYIPYLTYQVAPSIVDIALGDERFSTLVAAVTAAGLATDLAGVTELTVFAPTNDAFNLLPEGVLDTLLADPTGRLREILLYHVVAGRVPSSALFDGLTAPTLLGQPLTFTLDEDGAKVNGVNIVITDIFASNGLIHVIDAVLIPSE